MKLSLRHGFTLVELAIVLVIIGLIIGGILVADSMVNAARVNNAISQITQMDVALTDFKTKYQYPPGDAPGFLFEDGVSAGNGNNLVEDASGVAGLGRSWSGEVANFWPELGTVGLRSQKPYKAAISGGKLTVGGNNPNMPSIALGKKGTGIFFTNDNGYLDSYNISQVYVIGKVSDNDGSDLSFPHTGMGAMTIGDALRPIDLMAIDRKSDDAKASTGRIMAFSTIAAGTANSCFKNDSPASYNIANSKYACSAAIKYPLDAGTGSGGSGISCGGNPVQSDPGCSGSGGGWDQCTGSCTCPGGTSWNGSACAGPSCPGNASCTGAGQNPYPDCSCNDTTNCGSTGGIWLGGGSCDCSSSNIGWSWDGNSCYSSCLLQPPQCVGAWNWLTCTCSCNSGSWNGGDCI